MQEYTDPVDRLIKINEVIRFVLLDGAVGEYLSEGPFGRSRGSGRGMPERYVQAQRLRDSMRQQRISANFQRTMELKQRDLARSDAFREMVRQDRFNDAVARYKARRAGAKAASDTSGFDRFDDIKSPVATAQPDAGQSDASLPFAPGRGPGTSIGFVSPEEVKNLPGSVKGFGPGSPEEAAKIKEQEAAVKKGHAEDVAAGRAVATSERDAEARAEQERRGVRPDDKVGGVQADIRASRERAKAAGIAPGGANEPDAAEQARQQQSRERMDAATRPTTKEFSPVPRQPLIRNPLRDAADKARQAAGSAPTQTVTQQSQETSPEARRQAAREVQIERGVRPNQNLQATPKPVARAPKEVRWRGDF